MAIESVCGGAQPRRPISTSCYSFREGKKSRAGLLSEWHTTFDQNQTINQTSRHKLRNTPDQPWWTLELECLCAINTAGEIDFSSSCDTNQRSILTIELDGVSLHAYFFETDRKIESELPSVMFQR